MCKLPTDIIYWKILPHLGIRDFISLVSTSKSFGGNIFGICRVFSKILLERESLDIDNFDISPGFKGIMDIILGNNPGRCIKVPKFLNGYATVQLLTMGNLLDILGANRNIAPPSSKIYSYRLDINNVLKNIGIPPSLDDIRKIAYDRVINTQAPYRKYVPVKNTYCFELQDISIRTDDIRVAIILKKLYGGISLLIPRCKLNERHVRCPIE